MMNRRDAIKKTALIMGYAVSASTLAGVMAGCQPETGPKWTPVLFTKDQAKLVTTLVDRILPTTDTPGASDVGVDRFIDLMMAKYKDEEEKKEFMDGLVAVDSASQAAHKKAFVALSGEQQDAILVTMAEAAEGKKESFFKSLKEMTLMGYFTTEEIGRQHLNYDPIPGNYDGCIPITDNGRVRWTL